MLAKVCSAAVNGIEAYPVEVEVNDGWGETVIVIVVNKTPKPSKRLQLSYLVPRPQDDFGVARAAPGVRLRGMFRPS